MRWDSLILGYQVVGLVAILWLTTEAENDPSLHCAVMSTGIMSDQLRLQFFLPVQRTRM